MKKIIVFVPIQLDIDGDLEDRTSTVLKNLEVINNSIADLKLDFNPNLLLSSIGDSEIIDDFEEEE